MHLFKQFHFKKQKLNHTKKLGQEYNSIHSHFGFIQSKTENADINKRIGKNENKNPKYDWRDLLHRLDLLL